ncbi:auxin-responsive protein SAUR50-like [Curcuma longa]|uniref:auxin-responsive protein SAUR50-like n=1 Tax=Curcuma longa TaxID=136217 RepID=UPI003D9EE25D
MKNVEKFGKIWKLKHMMLRWRALTLGCGSVAGGGSSPPPGYVAVYVGPDRQRFVIRIRFLSLPAFSGLFRLAEGEYGFPSRNAGAFAFPCDPDFFEFILDALDQDEARYGDLTLEDFLLLFSDLSPSAAAANGSRHRNYTSCNSFSRLLSRTNA